MGSILLDKIVTSFPDGTVALNELDLHVRDEEFFVILGPSGAGKTTLLKTVAGLYHHNGGHLYIGGRRVDGVPPEDRNTAMTFESFALYPHMTVYDNIANPLRSPRYGIARDQVEREVQRVCDLLEIGHLLQRFPKELSGGQKQRVSLGRAMVRKPTVFLLDEPLSHVDAKVRHRMRLELNRLQRELNTTTLYVTHDYLEALSLADRVGILEEGQLVQVGTPTEIYRQPVNVSVAEQVGYPRINLLDAWVEHSAGEWQVRLFGTEGPVLFFPFTDGAGTLDWATGEHLLGLRPQSIRIHSRGSGLGVLPARVYVSTPFVTYAIVTLQVGEETELTALVPPDQQLQAGEEVELSFSGSEFLFFDPTTHLNRQFPHSV